MKRKILMSCLLVSLLAIPLSASNAITVTYYVSSSGSDSNPGTIDRPWRTIAYAGRKLVAGDTVYIRGGIYTEAMSILNSGTETNLIKVIGYPGENAVIDGGNAIPGMGGSLLSLTGDYIYASDIEVRNSSYFGVYLGGKHNRVNNIYAHHNRENGILINGDYGTVENSRIWRNALSNEYGRGNGWSSGLSATRDATDGITDYAIIRKNVVWENWGEGISSYEANQTVIEDNISHDNYSTNIYLSDTTNVLCQRNFIYMTTGSYVYGYGSNMGIMMGDELYNPPSANIKVINNIILNNKINIWWWPGVQGGGMNNVLVANNTLVNSSGGNGGVNFAYGTHQNVRFEGNIVVENGTGQVAVIANSPGLYFSNNLWSKTPPAIAAGQGDVIGDPDFSNFGILSSGQPVADDFKLSKTSLAINKAIKVTEVVDDFDKDIRDAAPDIGAFEYICAVAGSPTPVNFPTNTSLPPTATSSRTPISVNTSTNTPLPPTATSVRTSTPLPPTPTPMNTGTNTPRATATQAFTKTPAATSTAPFIPSPTIGQVVVVFQDGISPNKKYSGNKDAYISQSEPNTNFGNATAVQVGGMSGSEEVALIHWDIINVPVGKNVTSGSIEIEVSGASGQTYLIYQALRDWDDSQVTWVNASQDTTWQSPGASGAEDRGSQVLGTLSPTADGTYVIDFNGDGIKLIQDWIRKAAPNYGFILVAGSNTNSISLTSSDQSNLSTRPKLVVKVNASGK